MPTAVERRRMKKVLAELRARKNNSNLSRSYRAEAALLGYRSTGKIDPDYALRDLLADLRHYCRRHGIDFDTEDAAAKEHFKEETRPEHDVYLLR